MFTRGLVASLVVSLVGGCSVERTKTDLSGLCPTESFLAANNRTAGSILQGVLVDARNGTRIDLDSFSGNDGVFVFAGGEKFKARAVPQNGDSRLKGEFFVCDVPTVAGDYLIEANFSGFQPFQSKVTAAAARSIVPANIRLFPEGVNTKDFVLTATSAAGAVANALVRLEPTVAGATNSLSPIATAAGTGLDGFLAPFTSRLVSLTATSGSDGKVTFPAASLVLGATYNIVIIPAVASKLNNSTGTTVVMGVSVPSNGATSFYETSITLTANAAL